MEGDLWAIPVIIVAYGSIFGFPLALIGLVLVGLPLALLLRDQSRRLWMPLLALMIGSLVGRILYHLADHLLGFGIDHFWRWRIDDYGLLIGASSGLLWLLFARSAFEKGKA